MFCRRLLGWLLLGLLLGLPGWAQDVAGLPTQINHGLPVEISVFGLPPATDAYNVGAKANVAVAQAFMRRYPNVHLKPFSFLKVPAAGAASMAQDTDTLMAMAAGVAPDVLQVNFRQSDSFIRQGFLLPLDSFIDEWRKQPGGAAELARLFPSRQLWDVAKRIGPDNQEHTYCLPTILYAITMQYRKDVLRNAGLPERAPTDWNDFYNTCLQVTDPRPGKGIYGYTLEGSWHMTWILWSAGSEILKQKTPKSQEWIAAYDDDKALIAYQYAWKLVNGPWAICPTCDAHFAIEPGATQVTCPKGHHYTVASLADKKLLFKGVCSPTGVDAWGQGKQAFSNNYMTDVQMAGVDPGLVGVATVPTGPGGISSAELNSTMMALNGTLTNPARKEAAWAYIRFRTSEEAKRLSTKVFVDGGYAKYVNPGYLRRFGYQAYLSQVPAGWEQTYDRAMRTGHPEPYGKNAQQIYNEMDIAYGEVMLLKSPDPVKIKEILTATVARTNERLIGIVPPAERAKRDRIALLMVLLSVVLFGLLFKYTLATYGSVLDNPNQRNKAVLRRVLTAWGVMLPALAAVILFQYYPLTRGSVIAFQNYQVLLGSKWIGLQNFGNVLFAKEFWSALEHSLQYAAIALGLGFLAPVALALLLHEVPKGSLFFRIVFFLPSVTSGIVIMLLWMQLYDPSSYGMLNQLLAMLHIKQQMFLTDPKLAMMWVVVPSVWAGMGPGSIIYLAALRQIPEDYYEAADMDGAGLFAKLRMITIPYLKPLLIINFVGASVGAFKSFEPIWIMTGGGPAGTTQVVGLEIWQNAFMYLRYGYATAMGWMLASLLIGFTVFQLRYLSKVQFKLAKSE